MQEEEDGIDGVYLWRRQNIKDSVTFSLQEFYIL